jgi:hypothetical protein
MLASALVSAFLLIATKWRTSLKVRVVPISEVARWGATAQEANSSSNAFASFRSRVSNPSVNHP